MEKTQKLKRIFTRAAFALADGYIAASGIVLAAAEKTGSNIFFIQSVTEINVLLLVILTLVFGGAFFALFMIRGKALRWITPLCVAFFAFSVFLGQSSARPYLTLALAGAAIASVYVFKGTFSDKSRRILKGKYLYIAVLSVAVIMIFFTSWATMSRYWAYSASTYDFGIFCQMYESMATDLTQTTTLERGVPTQHFAVHFSPIYYILLPFYMISRRPEALLAAQTVVVYSAVIPLLLLCRKWKYDEDLTFLISMVFLFYPAVVNPCFYDFHENCFLAPLLLWTLYFIEKDQTTGIAVCALLLLCVKEETGFYLVILGVYALCGKKCSKISSLMLIIMGITGFIAATYLVTELGGRVMTTRYAVFMTSYEDSLLDVVINVIKNPVFFLDAIFNEKKLLFLLELFVPLVFVPFRGRKLSDWLLFIPLLIMNLATAYTYQYDIGFQYVFGTGTLLIFLFAKNFRYMKHKLKPAVAAALAAFICFMGLSSSKYLSIPSVIENKAYYQAADEVLDSIPRDATVFASTYLTPHLYDVKELYMFPEIYDNGGVRADYVALDNRSGVVKEYAELVEKLLADGYETISDSDVSFVTLMKYIDS